jgi:hypothetical protein
VDAALYAWRHCYQWLADVRQPNGLKYGKSEADWMLLHEEQEMERLLESQRAQQEEIELWGKPLDLH